MMCAGSLYSQTVTGKITDNENLPLPGASVMVKGTQNVVSTDMDGNYSIPNVAPGSVLQISFIGFVSQSIEVNNSTVINATLKASPNELDEIVVVGASVKRSDLTGAVGNLSGEKLKETPTPNLLQGMQGRIAGVYIQQNPTPGNGASIKIRGSNSISAGSTPIFVVDGLIMEGNFENINPNDVASIDVLKDASATAIYGSRGANGVVVITTKRGSRSGEGTVQFDTWVGVSEFSKQIPLMNGSQLFDLRVDAAANTYLDGQLPFDTSGVPLGLSRQEFINQITSDGSRVFAPYELESYRTGKSYNWLDEITRSGVQSNHNLSFSGGSEKGTYFVSMSFADQDGILKNSGFKRYNGKINLTQDVKSWLQIGTSTTFSRSEASYIDGGAFGTALGANPLLPIDRTATYLSYGEGIDNNQRNPILSLDIASVSKRNMLTTSNYISIKPVKGLEIRSTFGANIIDQGNFEYFPSYTGQSIGNSADGEAHHYRYSELNYQWDNTVTYSKVFADKHDINALFGYSAQKNDNNTTDLRARGFATDDLSYKYLAGASQRANSQLSSDFNTYTILSYFGRVNYTFDKKYMITGTIRRDGSSKFGPNNKWGTFPSAAVSWDIAKEDFLKDSKKINQLKLRTSYGISGNQNIGLYSYVTLYRPSFSGTSTSFSQYGFEGNPDIKWEKQKQLNIGFDAAGFDNRLSVSANYFYTDNTDLLLVRKAIPSLGYKDKLENIGALNNKGIELTISGAIVQTKDFRWDVSANISSAKNKITKLSGDNSPIYNFGGFTGSEIQRDNNRIVGKSINSIYVFQYDGIAQQGEDLSSINYGGRVVMPGDIKIKDRNGDGIISDSDRYVVGNVDPNYYGGFSSDLNYKGIGLNMIFAYSIGGRRTSGVYEGYMYGTGRTAAHTDLLDRWTPTNTDTDIPRAYYNGGRFNLGDTDKGIQNASFLRLNALTVSYTLPSDLLSRIHLKGLKLYVTGSNLFTITKYKGYDPESGDTPNLRMIVTGLNVSL